MPEINRIRVNNVKYNFGTQYYDDFTMRMYARNTIYDLANGGGKSVLMLLLMQNLIPNCTLDDKQPVEKLFRDGCGNTTIHSLIEWTLDEGDDSSGYRYMTTGFCARKAKDSSAEGNGQMTISGTESGAGNENASGGNSGTATIEYFNYCIFYHSYNKNDIINLPLIKDKEHISYQALRNYLLDLSHKNIDLKVVVFDTKGEYQRFISGYGLHESQWEIVRGINKTEGHVRTYFETNYKTTRKVIEDLLIEEIIAKAFLVRTEKDEGSKNGMARLLMNIRDQLKNLAEKKRDIASFDHQTELITLLSDRVPSFEDIFKEKDEVERKLADIYVTVKKENSDKEEEKKKLEAVIEEEEKNKNDITKMLAELRVSIDMLILDSKKNEQAQASESLKALDERLSRDENELDLAEAGNEYLEYLKDKARKENIDERRRMLSENNDSLGDVHTLAYNIKKHFDKKISGIESDSAIIREKLNALETENELAKKKLLEADTDIAVAENIEKAAAEAHSAFEAKIQKAYSELNDKSFEDVNVKSRRARDHEDAAIRGRNEASEKREKLNTDLYKEKEKLAENASKMVLARKEKEEAENDTNLFETSRSRLETLANIYIADETKDLRYLEEAIIEKERSAVDSQREKETLLRKLTKTYNDILAGRLIETTVGQEKVLMYLRTRHNIFAMTGMDYLAALPADKKEKILSMTPEPPYGIVTSDYKKVVSDQNIEDIDTGNEIVAIFDEDALGGENRIEIGSYNGGAKLLHTDAAFFLDENSINKLAAVKKEEIDSLNDEIKRLRDMVNVAAEDISFVRSNVNEKGLTAKDRLEEAASAINNLIIEKAEIESRITRLENEIVEAKNSYDAYEVSIEQYSNDILTLTNAVELSNMADAEKEKIKEAGSTKDRISTERESIREEVRHLEGLVMSERDRLAASLEEKKQLNAEWNGRYSRYYIDGNYADLGENLSTLTAAFDIAVSKNTDSVNEQDSLTMLSETILSGMERTIRSIEKRRPGLVNILQEMNSKGALTLRNKESIDSLRESYNFDTEERRRLEKKLYNIRSEYDKLSGSIDYAIRNITEKFGDFNREEDTEEALKSKMNTVTIRYDEAEKRLAEGKRNLAKFDKTHRAFEDIEKDVSRIIERNDIDTSSAGIITDRETMNDNFESYIIRYDNIQKSMEKAKLELVRTKGRISETLGNMGVAGLSTTIREDVHIPGSLVESEELVRSLHEMAEVIRIEKERVGKSLSDMELLHDSFVDQCLDRCLDVRTEPEMLPGLSGIVLDGEKIEMIKLSIPYIKDEFMRERMASYIDRTVDEADKINDDDSRTKFLRNSLTTKKLFGVIVTDMNKIKLSLYKRERIKEQSRYLRYEEAVGSTGQSQGISIQFLISIINYISGMYSPESIGVRTKTIFIDNPFGAAKDIYIWEPIFALLAANKVQPIVPARGASPAITGRFDVNYVLGQQRKGNREVTVVVNYESSTNQEELEYHELSYEQPTFEFI